jgi:hypothetical protein
MAAAELLCVKIIKKEPLRMPHMHACVNVKMINALIFSREIEAAAAADTLVLHYESSRSLAPRVSYVCALIVA